MKQPRWAFIHPFQLRLQRGIEVYLWELASALAESGVGVDILTWSGSLDVPAYVSPQVKIRRVPEIRYYQHLGAVPFYVWYLAKDHYDHIFVHFADYGEGLALNLARRVTDIPFSVVFHFPPSLVPHRYRAFERWDFQKNAAHLIAVSQATASKVEHWSGRACEVVSHGVDVERFKPDEQIRLETRRRLEIPVNAPVLISVAALEERKGIQWVIEAMPKVLEKFSAVRYLILGDGTYRAALDERVRQLGLRKTVSLLGFQRDVAPYLAASDVALLLSHGEASPVSLLEFASAGLPVLTSPHEPFPELIQPDWAQMVSEQNTNEVAQSILALLFNDAIRKTKGERARQFVMEHHQWSQMAEQYRALIEGKL